MNPLHLPPAFSVLYNILLQCLADTEFAATDDTCILNPKNCPDGLSVALFYKLEFDVDPNDLETNFTKTFEREYILSTGKIITYQFWLSNLLMTLSHS